MVKKKNAFSLTLSVFGKRHFFCNHTKSPGTTKMGGGVQQAQPKTLVAQNTLRRNAAGWKRNFQYAMFVLEFAGPVVSKRGFDPQYASVFDRYAASTRSLLDMFRFNFNTKFGKDKKPIKIRPATQNTQRVEISIRNATRRKRSGSGPLSRKRKMAHLVAKVPLWEGTSKGGFTICDTQKLCWKHNF